VASNDVQQMSTREYFSYLDQGAAATKAEDVQHLRTDLMRRWPGDPRADDLTEALYAHQERLAVHEGALRVQAGRLVRRAAARTRRVMA
jgi:hypothetical protein